MIHVFFDKIFGFRVQVAYHRATHPLIKSRSQFTFFSNSVSSMWGPYTRKNYEYSQNIVKIYSQNVALL